MRHKRQLCFGLAFIDIFLHSTLIWSWPTLTEIYKNEGYFDCPKENSENGSAISTNATTSCDIQITTLANVMVYSTGLLGLSVLIYGLIRDYLSFGYCRLACFLSLILSYFMMALSTPGESDYLLYFWIIQFGGGTSLMLNYFQVAKLFPGSRGLLIGVLNVSSDLSALIPQFWSYLIGQEILTYRSINLIWLALALLSMLLGPFFFPWYNVQESPGKAAEIETVKYLLQNNQKLSSASELPIREQLSTNLRYLKSPMVLFYLACLLFGNFVITASLSLMNEIIHHKVSAINLNANATIIYYEETLNSFNISRAIIAAVTCPILGVLVDVTRPMFKGKSMVDIKVMIIPYGLVLGCFAVFSSMIIFDTTYSLWIALIAMSINSTWVYVFYATGIEMSFPGATVGVLFSIIEIATGLFALLAEPLVNHTIETNSLWSYYYAMIGSSVGMGVAVCILLSIAFECGPRSFQAMDKYRKEELSENNDNDTNLLKNVIEKE